jgi:hypothetical protein
MLFLIFDFYTLHVLDYFLVSTPFMFLCSSLVAFL